jgi:hypothetical protein
MKSKMYKFLLGMVIFVANLQATDCCTEECNCNDRIGIYFGLAPGYAQTCWDNIDRNAFSEADIVYEKQDNFGIRAFGGYEFNETISFELGCTYLNKVKFSRWNEIGISNFPLTTIENYAVDFCMRVNVPLCCNLGMFTRIGVSYLISVHSIKWRLDELSFPDNEPIRHSPAAWNLMFGFGLYYNLTSCIQLEASWTRFEGHPSTDDLYQPNPNFYAFGIAYRF